MFLLWCAVHTQMQALHSMCIGAQKSHKQESIKFSPKNKKEFSHSPIPFKSLEFRNGMRLRLGSGTSLHF